MTPKGGGLCLHQYDYSGIARENTVESMCVHKRRLNNGPIWKETDVPARLMRTLK